MARDDVRRDIESRYRILNIARKRLQALREQDAAQGISTPPEVVNEIDTLTREVREMEQEIAILEDGMHSPMSSILDAMSPGERANVTRLTSKRGEDRITSQIETLLRPLVEDVRWIRIAVIGLCIAVGVLYLLAAVVLTVLVRG